MMNLLSILSIRHHHQRCSKTHILCPPHSTPRPSVPSHYLGSTHPRNHHHHHHHSPPLSASILRSRSRVRLPFETMVSLGESPPSSAHHLPPSAKPHPRSMRTVRSTIFQSDRSPMSASATLDGDHTTTSLTDSAIDFRLVELASDHHRRSLKPSPNPHDLDLDFDLSQALSDFSAYSSDISGELHRLASAPSPTSQPPPPLPDPSAVPLALPFSQAIDAAAASEGLDSTVDMCVRALRSPSLDVRLSAAAKLRLLAKNCAQNRAVIGSSGAIPALVPLLRCGDPSAQEHAATALLNLSLHEANKSSMTNSGAIKGLIYALKTGTPAAKQNSACALLSLSLVEDNRTTIGACGAIPPLVALLRYGTCRGKKDALTTLYKLCAARQNKERAFTAGAVSPLVELVGEQGSGTMEKAMVVLSSLAAIPEAREAIVAENGIPVLVEAIEAGSGKGKEFAVLTLLQLCTDSVKNRGLLVREGGIPPLVALSQTGTARAKHKAETLLRYLREPRQDASSSSP